MHVISQSCVLIIWTLTLTSVAGQDCTLEDFLRGPLYDPNFDTTGLAATYSGGKQVRVGCNVGYTGFFKLLCIEGKWQSRGTKCQLRSCGHPGDAEFSEFHLEKGDDFVFGSEVVYTCRKGYQRVSRTNSRRCLAGGWDGVVPVCEAQQCPVIHVKDNIQVTGDPEEATYGNVLRFSCRSRSEALDGLTEIHCDENGKWSGQVPTCIEIKCLAPVIENGKVLGNVAEYNDGEILQFRCNEKYKRAEDRPPRCIKVGDRAEWSHTPRCEPITCTLDPWPITGTRYEPDSRSVFSPSDTVEVICAQKYWISNHQETSKVVTCKEDGEWDLRPVCKEVICNNPRNEPLDYRWAAYHRWQMKKLDETVEYRCRDGYKSPDGRYQATCTRIGWTPTPLCQEIICNKPAILNAVIVRNEKFEYKKNDWVEYACVNANEGRHTISCMEDGWTKNHECGEYICPKPRDYNRINNPQSHDWRKKVGQTQSYTCIPGYKNKDDVGHATCTKEGWTPNPLCEEYFCPTPHDYNLTNNPQIHDWRKKVGQTQRYTCIPGYKNKDDMDRATCTNEGWTPNPLCEDTCSKVENGFAVGPYDGTYYYSCNEDYKHFTKGWWGEAKCSNGELSGPPRCIDNRKCGEIPEILHANIMKPSSDDYGEGQTIRIDCKKGYNPIINQIICLNGKWDLNGTLPTKICTSLGKLCNPPPKVQNAVVEISYMKKYLSETEVTYQCRAKYTMEGENTIRCKDGEWEKKNIKCIQYCEKPTDEEQTMTIKEETERYLNGDVIKYECIEPGVKSGGNATCVDGMWSEPIKCKGQRTLDE